MLILLETNIGRFNEGGKKGLYPLPAKSLVESFEYPLRYHHEASCAPIEYLWSYLRDSAESFNISIAARRNYFDWNTRLLKESCDASARDSERLTADCHNLTKAVRTDFWATGKISNVERLREDFESLRRQSNQRGYAIQEAFQRRANFDAIEEARNSVRQADYVRRSAEPSRSDLVVELIEFVG